MHLGYSSEGYTREQAEAELAYITEQVRRGEWVPPAAPEAEPEPVPTFHQFASEWFEAKRTEGGRRVRGLSPAGEADLRWQLSNHLLPAFARKRLDQISVADVARYRRAKVAEGQIGTTSINKTPACLSAILEQAVEYGHIERNRAKGKRRRLPAVKPRRTYLDCAEHIAALVDAAGALDAERDYRTRLFEIIPPSGVLDCGRVGRNPHALESRGGRRSEGSQQRCIGHGQRSIRFHPASKGAERNRRGEGCQQAESPP